MRGISGRPATGARSTALLARFSRKQGVAMKQNLHLDAEGYQIVFELETRSDVTDAFDATIHFMLNSRFGNLTFTSVPDYLMYKSLQCLTTYFEEHIAQIRTTPSHDSRAFIPPYSFQFQLQALGGNVRSQNDGSFPLCFMVNVGRPGEEGSPVYAGGESSVSLASVRRFIDSVKQLLDGASRQSEAAMQKKAATQIEAAKKRRAARQTDVVKKYGPVNVPLIGSSIGSSRS